LQVAAAEMEEKRRVAKRHEEKTREWRSKGAEMGRVTALCNGDIVGIPLPVCIPGDALRTFAGVTCILGFIPCCDSSWAV